MSQDENDKINGFPPATLAGFPVHFMTAEEQAEHRRIHGPPPMYVLGDFDKFFNPTFDVPPEAIEEADNIEGPWSPVQPNGDGTFKMTKGPSIIRSSTRSSTSS